MTFQIVRHYRTVLVLLPTHFPLRGSWSCSPAHHKVKSNTMDLSDFIPSEKLLLFILPSRPRETLHTYTLSHFNCVRLFVTPWTLAHQPPPSMEFPRHEHWSGLPSPPGDLPDPRIERTSADISCIAGRSLPQSHWRSRRALSLGLNTDRTENLQSHQLNKTALLKDWRISYVKERKVLTYFLAQCLAHCKQLLILLINESMNRWIPKGHSKTEWFRISA